MQEALLLFSLMFTLFIAGIPIAFSLLLCSALFLLFTGMRPLIVVPQRVMAGLDSFPLAGGAAVYPDGKPDGKGGPVQAPD